MTDKTRGILAVAGGSVATFFYGAFIFGFPGVMGQDWQAALHVGRGEIGNILFFLLAAVGVLTFFVGRWQEQVGIRWMMTIGGVFCGLNLVLVAYASELWMLYLWAFVLGAGSCFVYVPAITSVQRWFPKRRGLVSGIVNFAFGLAGAVMAPVFRYLLDTIGYVSMNLWLAVIALVAGLIAAQLTEAPASALPSAETGTVSAFADDLEGSLNVRQTIRTASFWCLWVTWAIQGAAGIAMVTLSTMYGTSRGLTLESAVAVLMAFNFSNGLSRLLTGYLSDVFGRNATMSFTFFFAGIAYLFLPHLSGLAILMGLAAVIGFAFGALFAVSAPLVMDCFGIRHFGAIFGLTFTAYGFVSGPLGPSLSGYVLDVTSGNFFLVFTYLGSFCLLSSVLIRFVVPPRSVPPGKDG